MTTTLDLKHPEKAGTLGAGLFHLDAEVKNKFSQVKQKIPAEQGEHKDQQVHFPPNSPVTLSNCAV